MEKMILRLKVFASKYQELVFQLLENGDELYGLCRNIIDSFVGW